MTKLLEDMMESVDETVHVIADTKPKHFDHVITATTSDGESLVVKLTYGNQADKSAQLAIMRKLFAKEQVIAYVSASEAWLSGQREVEPRHAIDKIEVVYLVAADADDCIVRTYLIDRGTDGRVSRLVKYMEEWRAKASESGRMSSLLVADVEAEGEAMLARSMSQTKERLIRALPTIDTPVLKRVAAAFREGLKLEGAEGPMRDEVAELSKLFEEELKKRRGA